MLSDACVWEIDLTEIDLTYNAEKWHSPAPSRAHYVTKYLRSRSIITNDTMLCARGRHAPQRDSLAFLVRLHSWCGWRRWKWERKGWNGVGLQLTRPTVLLNEIIAFGWHLFTNSCTQNLLAQRASGESVFGCPTENLLVPGNRMGGNFEPCSCLPGVLDVLQRGRSSLPGHSNIPVWKLVFFDDFICGCLVPFQPAFQVVP